MNEILASVALLLSLISAAGVALLLFKREDFANVESQLRTLKLELADVVDRLSVWQRRDAARSRSVGGRASNEQSGLFPDQHSEGISAAATGTAGKNALRAVARSRGLMP